MAPLSIIGAIAVDDSENVSCRIQLLDCVDNLNRSKKIAIRPYDLLSKHKQRGNGLG